MTLQDRAGLFLGLLYAKRGKSLPERLRGELSAKAKRDLERLREQGTEDPILLLFPERGLYAIHPSWITSLLRSYPKELRGAVQSALAQKQPPSPLAAQSLLHAVAHSLGLDEHSPRAALASNPFSVLLDLKPEQFSQVARLCGLWDLSAALKQVISGKNQKVVLSCLNPLEKEQLQQCQRLGEQHKGSPLALEEWTGTPESLLRAIEVRGTERIGQALHGMDGDFLWHLEHTLDSKRAQLLGLDKEKPAQKMQKERQSQLLMAQKGVGG